VDKLADKPKVIAPPPPPAPPSPTATAKAKEPVIMERTSGHTTIRVWDNDAKTKGLEILKMQDNGSSIDVWVKTK
jgi:hypothetical protein